MKNYVNGLGHIGIPTDRLEETVAFYEKLGCVREYETRLEEKNQNVVFLRNRQLQLEIYEEPDTAGCAGAINHFAFDCSDAQAAYKKAVESGCKILSDGIETLPFWENGIQFFIIEGPNQERVEFCQVL